MSPQDRMDRAQSAFADHRFSEARLDLGTLLQNDEGDVRALEMLARTQLWLGDGVGAQATLERLDDAGARPSDYRALLGEAYVLQGEYESALAIGEDLGDAPGLRLAALAHIGLGNDEEARSTFERGARASGDRSRLLADFARFEHMAGNMVRGVELADLAREADPQGLDPLLANAMIAQDTGNPGKALDFFETAHEHWPESHEALLGRIGALGDMGRLAEAGDLVEQAARTMPGNPDVTYLQARLAADAGDWQEVRALLQPLENSADPRAQVLYAEAMLELDMPEQALPRLARLVRQLPELPQARRMLARTQLTLGEAAAALATIRPLSDSVEAAPVDLAIMAGAARQTQQTADIDPALRHAPDPAAAERAMAQAATAMSARNWEEATSILAAIERWTGDGSVMVLANLAEAQGQAGDHTRAVAIAERALAVAPDHPRVLDMAGWLMVRSGQDRARGLTLLQRAARLSPGDAQIAQRLAQAQQG